MSSKEKSLIKVLIIPFSNQNISYAIKVSKVLRDSNIICDVYYDDKGIKQKMKYANRLEIPYVCIIGDDEEKIGQITLKNMKTGMQDTLSIEKAIVKIK